MNMLTSDSSLPSIDLPLIAYFQTKHGLVFHVEGTVQLVQVHSTDVKHVVL